MTPRIYSPSIMHAMLASGSANVTAGAILEGRCIVARQTMSRIVADVASKHGVMPEQLRAKGRTWDVSHPRQEAMFLAAESGKSRSEIARFFGCDHSTVVHGIRAHKARNAA